MKLKSMRAMIWTAIVMLLFAYVPHVQTAAAASGVSGPTSVEWNFDEDGNTEGWMKGYSNNGVASYQVSGGALQLSLNNSDPYWYATTNLGLQTTPDQTFTIRMKSTMGTYVSFYFDTDLYPGLSEAKQIIIPITADGEYHEYSVKAGGHPNWKGTVQNLRMDLEPAASVPSQVSIDYIHIGDASMFSYEFNNSTNGWSSVSGLTDMQAGASAVSASVTGDGEPTIGSGVINKSADDIGDMSINTRVTGSATALKIAFTTDSDPDFSEAQQLIVPISSSTDFQNIPVKLWEHPSWTGAIQQMQISLVGASQGDTWEVDNIRFQSVAPPHYQWNEAGNAEGWIAANDMTTPIVANGTISSKVTGGDPNLNNENVEGAIGERDKTITVRMSSTAGSYVSIFFATDTASFFSESRRIDFTITPDGSMHDYTIPVGDHPSWKGKITKIRLDLEGGDRSGAVMTLDDLQFVSSPTGADLTVKRSVPALHVGQEAEISVDIANTGGKAFLQPQAQLIVSGGLEVEGDATASVSDLHPGDKATATWKVKAVSESPSQVEVKLNSSGYSQSSSVALPVLKDYQAVAAARLNHAEASMDSDGNAVLENGNTRIVAVKSAFGYGQYEVDAWDDAAGWKPMASVQPFASAVVRAAKHATETVAFYPTSVNVTQASGSAAMSFQGTTTDSSGRNWTYTFDFSLDDSALQVKTSQNVRADREADLLNLYGPVLTVGEGSFGASKDEALFPGLEWLVGNESSSSQLDGTTPAYLRLVPNPYKITVPLMAVRQGGHIVSLSWDPHQKWDGTNDLPAAEFASPNWVENQNNHVMGLSALSVPAWVKENNLLASTSYALEAGQTISLTAGITTAAADSVAKAVTLYEQEQPLPDVPQVRSFQDEADLGLDAYLRTYWNEQGKGWYHYNTSGLGQYNADMVSLKMLAQVKPERKDQVNQVISEALSAVTDKTKIGNPDYHIPQFQAPFFVGYMNEALAGLKGNVTSLIQSQSPSGAWTYTDTGIYNPPLGSTGSPELGVTAGNTAELLKYAMMTGDEQAKSAAFKGIAAFETMGDVPRAGQPWEVPMHTPDIMAAANAVNMYVQAYKMTGDSSYLDKAKKWAEAGTPFVYTWGVDSLPFMKYATIPVFGASAYINPWFGVPVQWNGLVYGYSLLELAQYDRTGPWKKLAEGIMSSAEIQQASAPDEPQRGGYPDNWRLISNSRSDSTMLNPEEIMKTSFLKRYIDGEGPNPDVQTTVIPGCPASSNGVSPCTVTRVTTLADVSNTLPTDTQHLVSFQLTYTAGETTYVLVAGREMPRKITVNDVDLNQSESQNDSETGWSYSAESGYLILKIKHSGTDNVMIHY